MHTFWYELMFDFLILLINIAEILQCFAKCTEPSTGISNNQISLQSDVPTIVIPYQV